MAKSSPSLTDLYDLSVDRLFLTGPQAILRLVLMQSERDRRAGLTTAGYVTGYRGSPVGTVDNQFRAAKAALQARHIKFEPGLNEDLAATALWGTQQAEMRGEGRFDGVFGLWYGKGPGVDRSGDVFRHVNMAGTSPHGGVLAIAGDDHSGESSTVVHASDWALADAMMPVLSPAGVQEIIDYGLVGYGLSRYAGVWVGLKAMHDTVESAAVVEAGEGRGRYVLPTDHRLPPGGLGIRPNDDRVPQEERLHAHKIPAVLAFLRANGLNRTVFTGGRTARLGVVAAGKNYLDARQALDELGIDEKKAARLGLRLLKVGAVWPLEPEAMRDFARGLDTILVVEEKRALIELQLRDILYGEKKRPAIVGKTDERGAALFASHGVLEPNQIARAIAARLGDREISARAEAMPEAAAAAAVDLAQRVPYFCAGCPHNTSTALPEGARAYAGIGCHWLAQFVPDRRTEGFTHMGGEGANWVGEAPFSTRGHMFQNLGDGTYNHSGMMAIRHAVSSGVNITYKILFNDAVAMTGGQKNDGGLSVPAIAQQVRAFGVDRIAVISDEEGKHGPSGFPPHTSFHHRTALDEVQREMMAVPGASVIIYDQTCAAEKRRRRKRGLFTDPDKRVFINPAVCEGCGDCGVKSNCVAVVPLETQLGTKRAIDQSACNKDFSCLNGFCPSFVTVHGAKIAKAKKPAGESGIASMLASLPDPELPALDHPYTMLVTGVGGTGVVTVSALLGQAAHLEGKGFGAIDMTGLAQKGGAVACHMRVAEDVAQIHAIRAGVAGADLVLGCDLVVTASNKVLETIRPDHTAVVFSDYEMSTADFTRNADLRVPGAALRHAIAERAGKAPVHHFDAHTAAVKLFGDSIAANVFLLGYAYQLGRVPVGSAAIEQAIELNGASVEMSKNAFRFGRLAAHDMAAVERIIGPAKAAAPKAQTLDDIIAYRADQLTQYQDDSLAERFRSRVSRMAEVERSKAPGRIGLAEAVARGYFKLLAYKDEYEVARLFTTAAFAKALSEQFETHGKLEFHLAPPLLARRDSTTGEPRKMRFGSWMLPVFRLLAKGKWLRGTAWDPFGYTAERRSERQMIADYEKLLDEIAERLTPASHATAVALATLALDVKGFGHIKERNHKTVKAREAALLAALRDPSPTTALKAAE